MKNRNSRLVLILATLIYTASVISAQTYVAEFRDDSKLWGYISSDGKVIIPSQYASVSPFSPEGLAVVKDPSTKTKKYINIKGDELKPEVNAQDCREFKDGMAPVKVDEKWGFINTEGKLIIPAEYKHVEYFEDGRSWVTDFTGTISLIDKQGNRIDISSLGIDAYKRFSEGLSAVKIGATWGFIDVNGKLVIEAKYLKADYFSDGLTAVKVNDKQMGYINKQGEEVIKAAYLSCEQFDPVSGMARVKTESGVWQYIDKAGNSLNVNTKKYNDFQEGLCVADNNGDPLKYGFIKKDGTWAIEAQFEGADDFRNGIARIKVNKKWGAIDKTGKVIIEPIYVNLEDFYVVK